MSEIQTILENQNKINETDYTGIGQKSKISTQVLIRPSTKIDNENIIHSGKPDQKHQSTTFENSNNSHLAQMPERDEDRISTESSPKNQTSPPGRQIENLIEKIYKEKSEDDIHQQVQEAIKLRDRLLMDEGNLQMSKDEYKTYFNPNIDWRQQNTGNCVSVAELDAARHNPFFEVLVRTSMHKLPDNSWKVKIPLLDPNGEVISITPEELLPQNNPMFMKGFWKLKPTSGPEGLQVLEAALMKKQFGSVDRQKAEGSTEDLYLLLGENAVKKELVFQTHDSTTGAWDKAPIEEYLKNYNINSDIAVAIEGRPFHKQSSIDRFLSWMSGSIKVKKGSFRFIIPYHGYSIQEVDPDKRKITLANAHNTKKPFRLTFSQFEEHFDNLLAARIDFANLIKNMKTFLPLAKN